MQLGRVERKRVCFFLPLTCRTPLFLHFRAALEKAWLRSASTKQVQRIKCSSVFDAKNHVFSRVGRLSTFPPTLWISIKHIPPPFLLLQRTISIQSISTTPAGYKSIFWFFFLLIMNIMLVFNFKNMYKGYAYQISNFVAFLKKNL
jgi:hypothetical protein